MSKNIKNYKEQDIFNMLFNALHDNLFYISFHEVEHKNGAKSLGLDDQSIQKVLNSALARVDGLGSNLRFVPRPFMAYSRISSTPERFQDKLLFRKRWIECFKMNKKFIKSARHQQFISDTVKNKMQSTREISNGQISNIKAISMLTSPATKKSYISASFEVIESNDQENPNIMIAGIGFTTHDDITFEYTSTCYRIYDQSMHGDEHVRRDLFAYGQTLEVPLNVAVDHLLDSMKQVSSIVVCGKVDSVQSLLKEHLKVDTSRWEFLDIRSIFASRGLQAGTLEEIIQSLGIICENVNNAGNRARCILMSFMKLNNRSFQ